MIGFFSGSWLWTLSITVKCWKRLERRTVTDSSQLPFNNSCKQPPDGKQCVFLSVQSGQILCGPTGYGIWYGLWLWIQVDKMTDFFTGRRVCIQTLPLRKIKGKWTGQTTSFANCWPFHGCKRKCPALLMLTWKQQLLSLWYQPWNMRIEAEIKYFVSIDMRSTRFWCEALSLRLRFLLNTSTRTKDVADVRELNVKPDKCLVWDLSGNFATEAKPFVASFWAGVETWRGELLHRKGQLTRCCALRKAAQVNVTQRAAPRVLCPPGCTRPGLFLPLRKSKPSFLEGRHVPRSLPWQRSSWAQLAPSLCSGTPCNDKLANDESLSSTHTHKTLSLDWLATARIDVRLMDAVTFHILVLLASTRTLPSRAANVIPWQKDAWWNYFNRD